jgi:hypothetical protein
MVAFMREERKHMESKMKEQQEVIEKMREEQRQAIQQMREDLSARPRIASDVISEPQLEALQARLQVLHTSQQLTDETMCSLEDCLADCIELMPDALATIEPVEKVVRMIKLSERMCADCTFARQLQRKFA